MGLKANFVKNVVFYYSNSKEKNQQIKDLEELKQLKELTPEEAERLNTLKESKPMHVDKTLWDNETESTHLQWLVDIGVRDIEETAKKKYDDLGGLVKQRLKGFTTKEAVSQRISSFFK